MFDFSRITDTLGDFFSAGDGVSNSIGEVLSGVGIDPAALENLPIDQISEKLSAAGLDLSSLSEGQLGEIVQGVQDGGIENLDLSGLTDQWSGK